MVRAEARERTTKAREIPRRENRAVVLGRVGLVKLRKWQWQSESFYCIVIINVHSDNFYHCFRGAGVCP